MHLTTVNFFSLMVVFLFLFLYRTPPTSKIITEREKETAQEDTWKAAWEGTCHVTATTTLRDSAIEEQSEGASHKHKALFVDLGFCTQKQELASVLFTEMGAPQKRPVNWYFFVCSSYHIRFFFKTHCTNIYNGRDGVGVAVAATAEETCRGHKFKLEP